MEFINNPVNKKAGSWKPEVGDELKEDGLIIHQVGVTKKSKDAKFASSQFD